MIITIEEGRNALRIDGDYNDDVITTIDRINTKLLRVDDWS